MLLKKLQNVQNLKASGARMYLILFRYMDSIRYGLLSRIEKCKEERATSPQAKQLHRKVARFN